MITQRRERPKLILGHQSRVFALAHRSFALSQTSISSHSRYLQTLKDYALLMEYKRLRMQSPLGIYVIPSTDSLRRWHGVIFLRKGPYRKAIFKFTIHIPPSYPNEAPKILFLPHSSQHSNNNNDSSSSQQSQMQHIYHPLIDPVSGELDLSISFSEWRTESHHLALVLIYIKRVFYKSDYWRVFEHSYHLTPLSLSL